MLYLDITFHRSKGLKPLGGGHSLTKFKKQQSELNFESSLLVPTEFYLYVSHSCRILVDDWGMKSYLSPNTNPDPMIITKEFLGCSLLYWDVGFYDRFLKCCRQR